PGEFLLQAKRGIAPSMQCAYVDRLEPTPDEETFLARTAGACRPASLGAPAALSRAQSHDITALREQVAWMRERRYQCGAERSQGGTRPLGLWIEPHERPEPGSTERSKLCTPKEALAFRPGCMSPGSNASRR